MNVLKGVCCFHSETGTEGGDWAFQDARYIIAADNWSYAGLHILEDGDQLTIFSKENPAEIVWAGKISLIEHDFFTQTVGPHKFWIHADQNGVDRETWGKWFLENYPAELIPSK